MCVGLITLQPRNLSRKNDAASKGQT